MIEIDIIEINIPIFYDTNNKIFENLYKEKKYIISEKVLNSYNIKTNPWWVVILEVIKENFNNKKFKVKEIEHIIKLKKKYRIPSQGLHPYFTKLSKRNPSLLNKHIKKRGYWYLNKNV